MLGPYPAGTHCDFPSPTEWDWETGRLVRGSQYTVTKSFVDADGQMHPVGETWTFLAGTFSRYDDLLLVIVEFPNGEEWRIPLLWRPRDQEEVIEDFLDFVSLSDQSGRGNS
jgi:hypothetical protein